MQAGQTLLTSLALAVLLIGAAVTPVGATQTDDAPEPSMTVDLAADGDAEITIVSTFNLTRDSEQAAWDESRANETARNAYRATITDGLVSTVRDTENATGREMALTNASVEFSRTGSTGVATYTATWAGLAATEDGTMTLSEPFASAGEFDKRLVIELPEGYELDSVSVGPTTRVGGSIVYEAGTSLDGFTAVASNTPAGEEGTAVESPTANPVTTTGGSGPGFGVAVAIAALVAAAAVYRRG